MTRALFEEIKGTAVSKAVKSPCACLDLQRPREAPCSTPRDPARRRCYHRMIALHGCLLLPQFLKRRCAIPWQSRARLPLPHGCERQSLCGLPQKYRSPYRRIRSGAGHTFSAHLRWHHKCSPSFFMGIISMLILIQACTGLGNCRVHRGTMRLVRRATDSMKCIFLLHLLDVCAGLSDCAIFEVPLLLDAWCCIIWRLPVP